MKINPKKLLNMRFIGIVVSDHGYCPLCKKYFQLSRNTHNLLWKKHYSNGLVNHIRHQHTDYQTKADNSLNDTEHLQLKDEYSKKAIKLLIDKCSKFLEEHQLKLYYGGTEFNAQPK